MTKIQNSKPIYDLEERTFQYAKDVDDVLYQIKESDELKGIFSSILEKSK